MRRRTFVQVVGGSALGLLAGCLREKKEEVAAAPAAVKVSDKPPYPAVTLCGNCGQVKGSALCCSKKPDQPRCPRCGLFAGSPGCCRIKKGAPVTLCGKCGQVKGSDVCCKPGQAKCGSCGLSKPSPGCCRISKPEVQKAAMAQAKA